MKYKLRITYKGGSEVIFRSSHKKYLQNEYDIAVKKGMSPYVNDIIYIIYVELSCKKWLSGEWVVIEQWSVNYAKSQA
jgi:hypothetical protein